MAIAIGAITTGSGSGGFGASISKPAGTAVGDLLAAHCYSNTAVTSTGFTSRYQSTGDPSFGQLMSMLYRVADGSEASSITFNFASSGSGIITLIRITGAAQTTPIEAHSTGAWVNAGSTSAPSVTTLTDNAMVLYQYVAVASIAGTWSATGPTENYDDGTLAGYSAIKATAGATAAQSASYSGSGYLIGYQVSVKPLVPPTQPRVGMIGI